MKQKIIHFAKMFLGITVAIVLVALMNYGYAAWTNPTGQAPSANRSVFIHEGASQTKDGDFHIGGTNALYKFSTHNQEAYLHGGWWGKNNMPGNNALTITSGADAYIGQDTLMNPISPATLSVNNKIKVSGNIQDDALAHGNTGQKEVVCVNAIGVLFQADPVNGCVTPPPPPTCAPINNAPQNCVLLDVNGNTGGSIKTSFRCQSVNDTNSNLVTQYDVEVFRPGSNLFGPPYAWRNWGVKTITSSGNFYGPYGGGGSFADSNWAQTNSFNPGNYNDYRFRIRGKSIVGNTTCNGPWTEFNTSVSGPNAGGGGNGGAQNFNS